MLLKLPSKAIITAILLLVICGCKKAEEELLGIPGQISPPHFSGQVANTKALWLVNNGFTHYDYSDAEDPILAPVIILTKRGDYLLDGKNTALAQLAALFLKISRKVGTDLPIFLWADRNADTIKFKALLDTMNDEGLYRLNLGGVNYHGQAVYRRLIYLPSSPVYPPGDGYNHCDIRGKEKLMQIEKELENTSVGDKLVIIAKGNGEQEGGPTDNP